MGKSAKQRYYDNLAKKGKISKSQASSMGAKQSSSSSGQASSGYGSLVDSATQAILGSSKKNADPVKDFEKVYSKKLTKEDLDQAKALFEPYYNNKISTILEDLNTTLESDSISYDRTLRRARASMALSGGAIGTERTSAEGEMQTDYNTNRTGKIKQAERVVGTDKLTSAGIASAGTTQEGSLISEMKNNIADQQLWYKNQRAERYYADAGVYYNT